MGGRWYAWAWIGTVSPEHYLLICRCLQAGEMAFGTAVCPQGSCEPRPG
jgi:hypothetical protein